jgi:hypothetical protein
MKRLLIGILGLMTLCVWSTAAQADSINIYNSSYAVNTSVGDYNISESLNKNGIIPLVASSFTSESQASAVASDTKLYTYGTSEVSKGHGHGGANASWSFWFSNYDSVELSFKYTLVASAESHGVANTAYASSSVEAYLKKDYFKVWFLNPALIVEVSESDSKSTTGWVHKIFHLNKLDRYQLVFNLNTISSCDNSGISELALADSYALLENITVQCSTAPTPVPATALLFASGLLGLLGWRRGFPV